MIISFYDENFKALQNNSGLVVDKSSYSLIKRPVDMNDFSCKCEAFTENIQPTFLVVKDDKGSNSLVYSSLAGIPLLNNDNQTEINGTDIKSMLSSDILVQQTNYTFVKDYITYIFDEWQKQVNQNSFKCVLDFKKKQGIDEIELSDLKPQIEDIHTKINAWEEIQLYLRRYKLYMDTELELYNDKEEKHEPKVKFIIGRTMFRNMNIKLWEYGIKNYGKWVADTNECQGYYLPDSLTSDDDIYDSQYQGYKWILTSQNKITIDESKRDIYPIKRKVIVSSESLQEANTEALTELLDSLYNENIELPTQTIKPDFETNFRVFVKQGEEKYEVEEGTKYYANTDTSLSTPLGTVEEDTDAEYIQDNKSYGKIKINGTEYLVNYNDILPKPYKKLPCGELHYNATGLTKVQIGYRYTSVNFI